MGQPTKHWELIGGIRFARKRVLGAPRAEPVQKPVLRFVMIPNENHLKMSARLHGVIPLAVYYQPGGLMPRAEFRHQQKRVDAHRKSVRHGTEYRI